jgi:Ti-type conjugative transfer relaxase TraA
MAIGFARLEFVQRSAGKTACGKSAYNAREKIHFEGTNFAEAKAYNWSYKEKPAYHEVLLPSHVDAKFKSLEILWNTAEKKENRHNSQVAMEMVLALPDDKVISLEDKIELVKTFVEEYFVKNGLAAQIDIHQPDQRIQLSEENGEIENLEHNWHAHILITTRRFKENGLELEDHKARDLMPIIRGEKVISGPNWGKVWTQHQNHFFEDKGLDLRVDENGIVAQKHLGPVRMRGRAFALEEENQVLSSLNQVESKDATKILDKIIENKSVFTMRDVERFLQKHVEREFIDGVREEFWKQERIVQLLDPINKGALDKFSTFEVIEEEKQILRLADRIHESPAFKLKYKNLDTYTIKLNQEQKCAFDKIIQGRNLSCIEGHAGTGKSYLLSALREAYASQGYKVRAFGPDNATADVLKEKGFDASENIYRFLFSLHHGKREVSKGKEIWILDESSKLGNRPLLEFLKAAEKHQVQLIFAGCSSQLPSVERGGFFKTFCDRYGAEELIDIQRQKHLEQRAMAKNLATGNMSIAIDQLAKLSGLKWSETKEEAIEELIKAWAMDQTAFPTDSSLIVANTNSEVRVLNEMARIYRREKGELEEAEYACKAHDGKKIIVSVGDKIEFRQKDNKLGVQNGMRGTLVAASEDRFVVALQGSQRKIVFSPKEYAGFQLGYATTYNRSQGQTLDRVYVLHSPQMNREKFYVTLTRHSHRVNLYAAYTDVSCVADLKRQAFRKSPRENTLQYTTEYQLQQQATKEERKQSLNQLKESPSLLEKIKGYTLGAWDAIKGKIQEHRQHSKDLHPSQRFFNPDLKEKNFKVEVIKIKDEYLNYEQRQGIQKTFGKILEKASSFSSHSNSITADQSKRANWSRLSEAGKALLDQYYQTLNQASILYTLVQAEAQGGDLKFSPHFKEWQMTCATRNKQAYEVLKAVPQAFIREAIGKEAFQILQERSSKHEAILQRQIHSDFIEDLKERIEPLLYRLFPDGPTGRDSKGLRFGLKGSLSVVCRGEQIGNFYDFEKGEGGGPLKLVERALNLNPSEAREWARDFLSGSKEVTSPFSFRFNSQSQKIQEWNSLIPNPHHAASSLKELSLPLSQKYQEVARHAYLDEKGDLLFYVLRLVDKQDPTKKQIRPLSYGIWQGSEKPCWCLKNYQAEKRPLYHLDQLYKNPLAKVLIVEGEKTADAAGRLFADQNIICSTWQGGASAILKSSWTPLHGRDIIVWPDNDEAGFKAADQLCTVLRQTGVKSLSVIDKQELMKHFPEKWDLADQLPQRVSTRTLTDMMLMAKEKSAGIDRLSLFVKGNEGEFNSEKLYAQEILWRVEERLWFQLEEKHGNQIWKIKEEILYETQHLLSQQAKLDKKLQAHHHLSPELANRIAKQLTLQQAENGKVTNPSQINELKQIMGSIGFSQINNKEKSDLSTYAIDKSLGEALTLGMRTEILSKKIQSEVKENIQKIATQAKIQEIMQLAEQEQIKQKDRGMDFGF